MSEIPVTLSLCMLKFSQVVMCRGGGLVTHFCHHITLVCASFDSVN